MLDKLKDIWDTANGWKTWTGILAAIIISIYTFMGDGKVPPHISGAQAAPAYTAPQTVMTQSEVRVLATETARVESQKAIEAYDYRINPTLQRIDNTVGRMANDIGDLKLDVAIIKSQKRK